MVLEDIFLVLHFLPRPSPVHPYFCPSIFVFTRPNDGWPVLYIKLCPRLISASKPSFVQYMVSTSLDSASKCECLPTESDTLIFLTVISTVNDSNYIFTYLLFITFIIIMLQYNNLFTHIF